MEWNLKEIFPNKVLIGLTGGNAGGKSLAGRYFAALGLPLLDTDAIYHDLLESDKDLINDLSRAFGREIAPGGCLNRAALSQKVFGNPALLPRLNEITHPKIAEALIERLKAESGKAAVIEATLLFESGLSKGVHVTVTVTAPPEKRLLRLMERNNLSRAEAEKRLLAQESDEYRVKQSDYVITNNGSRADLERAVKNLVSRLGL